jgi:hypothetical protein
MMDLENKLGIISKYIFNDSDTDEVSKKLRDAKNSISTSFEILIEETSREIKNNFKFMENGTAKNINIFFTISSGLK